MARLNKPADFSHTTPVLSQATDAVTDSDAMSSPPLRPLTFEASLQSHGADNLPLSPLRRSSDRSSFSPADCRTLETLLRNTSVSSPLEALSPLEQGEQGEQGEQLHPDTPISSVVSYGRTEEAESYQFVGGETTDAGYEDEDDSMELSEGTEGSDTSAVLNDLTSPSVSKSGRRLQDSVSTHDEKDRLRYSDRQSSISKQPKSKRREKSVIKANAVVKGDTIEDNTSLPGDRASTSHHPRMVGNNSDRDSEPDGVLRSSGSLRFSFETSVNGEHVEEQRTQLRETPGVTGVHSMAVLDGIGKVGGSDTDRLDADKEEITVMATSIQRRKNSQSIAPKFALQASSGFVLSENKEESQSLMPNTPVTAIRPLVQAHIVSPIDQNIPDTPFAKTLGYFKQFKGIENARSKPRRNTVLSGKIIEIPGSSIDEKDEAASSTQEESSSTAPDTEKFPKTSALADLEGLTDFVDVPRFVDEVDEPRKVTTPSDDFSDELASNNATDGEPTGKHNEKQIILYPQHPAFIKAIGMIPATMFWVTAAPVVKYTSVAVEMLMDKLRETYL